MMARIAYEVRRIGVMLGSGEMPTYESFLPTFDGEEEQVTSGGAKLINPELKDNWEAGGGYSGIETEDDVPLDLKWQVVNARAKSAWLGVLEAAAREGNCTIVEQTAPNPMK